MGLEVSSAPLPQSQGPGDRSVSSSVSHYTQPLTCFRASKVRGNWLWMGPEGHSTSKTSRRSANCRERGWVLGSRAVPCWGRTAFGTGTHLPQGHPTIGILGGGGWHRTSWQGLELNSRLSAAPQDKQGMALALLAPSVVLAQAAVPSPVPFFLPGSLPC